MTKALRKAIMTRSRFKNINKKMQFCDNWNIYKKQINFWVKLLRKTKQEYFNNVDMKSVRETTKFWKTIKPYFSNFNITQNIRLKQFQFYHANNLFEDHTSIIRIKSNLDNVTDKFDFKKVHEKDVKREIMNSNSKKNIMPRCYTS